MTVFQKDPALTVQAISDIYEANLERTLSTATNALPNRPPRAYPNYQQLLADKEVNAVLIGDPEHRHAWMALDALAASKDVCVQKPLCRTPEEGVALVRAEQSTKQIVQVGMQRRSYDL
jgi:predicted dehydrogenase